MSSSSEQNDSLSTTKRALRALQDMRARLDALESAANDPIAIVGIGCRFPGAKNPAAFWQLLCDGIDPITEVPPDK